MKHFLIIGFIALSALSALSIAAQSPSKILKQAEQAMGGSKALRASASWQKRGTITRISDGATGKFITHTTAPNLYKTSYDVGGLETESGYNGKSSWTRDSHNGLRTLTGGAGIAFQAEAAYRSALWLDAKKEKFKLVSGGTYHVGGVPVDVVHINTPKGAKITLFIDKASKMILREEFSSAPAGWIYEYSEYRRVGNVMVPHTIRIDPIGSGTMQYEVILDDVRPNAQFARSEYDFPKLPTEALPDIPALLRDVQANEDRVETMLDTYSFVQRSTRRELGKDGSLVDKDSETFQLSFYKGRRVRRQIEKNGKPLTPSQQEDEDKEVAKRVADIEKEIAKAESKGGPPSSEDSRRVSIAEVLRASMLSNPRRERIRGRDVIVFDFEPNPSFDYKNAKSMLKFFGKTAGAMWIDEKDKQVARLQAYLADSFNVGGGVLAKLRKGATFTLEQERVNDEIWLPSVADINLSVRVFMVKGIDLNQVIRSYDYRKFTTEVKDAKVDEIKGKPGH